MRQAQFPGDLRRKDHVRVIREAVGPGPGRHACRRECGGDQAAVLAAGQAQLDRRGRVPQRGDGRDQRLGDQAPGVSGPRVGRTVVPGRWGVLPQPGSFCLFDLPR